MKLLSYLQKKNGISRRDLMQMIQEKALQINNTLVTDINAELALGDLLTVNLPGGDAFEETIENLPQLKPMMVLFNKPKGYVVSKDDPHNHIIYELLPESWKKDFFYIGRLDKDSHGLLLLTNDTALVDHYENPRSLIRKVYEVRIDQPFSGNDRMKALKGMSVDQEGIHRQNNPNSWQLYSRKKSAIVSPPIEKLACETVSYEKRGTQHWVRIVLTEGKKRHIRRLLTALQYKVLDLYRTKVGLYEIGDIREGKRRMQPIKQVRQKFSKIKQKKLAEKEKRAAEKKIEKIAKASRPDKAPKVLNFTKRPH